jgi:hypothetical protein
MLLRLIKLPQDADLAPMMNFIFGQVVQHPSQIETRIGIVANPLLSEFRSI